MAEWQVDLFRYRVNFKPDHRGKTQLTLNAHGHPKELAAREGLLLLWQGTSGQVWVTEAAPLPGFSKESVEEAEQALTHWLARPFPLAQETVSDLPNSVRFALELFFYRQENPVKRFLVPCQSCLLITESEALKSAATAKHIKLKMGALSLKDDIDLFNQACSETGAQIRVDPNRSWLPQHLQTFIKSVDRNRIEFIEEPLKGLAAYEELNDSDLPPIALDEHLLDTNIHTFLAATNLTRVLVLKPMLLGFNATLEWIQWARAHQYQWLLSGAFELPVSLDVYRELAAIEGSELAQGLDTLRYLDLREDRTALWWEGTKPGIQQAPIKALVQHCPAVTGAAQVSWLQQWTVDVV